MQVGGRALGEVCNAYPERLVRCLVLVSLEAGGGGSCVCTGGLVLE